MGIANRTDFDLKQHAKFSGKSLTYFDEDPQRSALSRPSHSPAPVHLSPGLPLHPATIASIATNNHPRIVKTSSICTLLVS